MRKILLVLLVMLSASSIMIVGCGSKDQDPLADLLLHFEQNGFTVGEKITKDYSMVGAVDGFGIELDGEEVEFYLYDPDTADDETLQRLEDAETLGTITMWNMTFPALLNGDIMMINHDEHSNKDEVINIFNSY